MGDKEQSSSHRDKHSDSELQGMAARASGFKWNETRRLPLPGWKLLSPALTFNVFGHIIVDNHRHILDVDTTTCHICSHQNILGPSLEVGQCKFSLLLAFSTMQCASIVLLEEWQGEKRAVGSWKDTEGHGDSEGRLQSSRAEGEGGRRENECYWKQAERTGELEKRTGENRVCCVGAE